MTLRNEFEDLDPIITDIAARGLTYGIHVLIAANRWMELRPAIRDMLGTKLELRLGDPSDSMLDRRTAMNVPEQSPGRGITPDRYQFLAALPRADGRSTVDDLSEGTAKLINDVGNAWPGPGAPRVRLLPAVFPYSQLPVRDARPGIPIGIAEADLQPVFVDLSIEPHFLVYGDSESGKSTFLRSFAQAIVDRQDPESARMIVVDYRRSLLGAVTDHHLIGYGTSATQSEKILAEVAQVMESRLPGPDVTPEQLRTRSWWKGPDLYVLVDDYDLVAGAQNNPLTQLRDHLGQARDIGLHVIVARRSGGAGRAMYEPVTMAIRELGTAGIVMSGERDEGALLGNVKPSQMPPGRGWLVSRRGGAQLIQLAWLEQPQ
jgi:S-DNA-T family DNA segregation ATPase FtsK/SpoIIIE